MQRIPILLAASATGAFLLSSTAGAAPEAKPLKVLLITGGCCHSYATQKDILKNGIEERINATVDQIHTPNGSTKPPLPIYGNPDYAKGYDLVIHDECAADVSDPETVKAVLKPHQDGIPGVVLHCAMHSYRVGKDFKNPITTTGEPRTMWFEFLGLQSTGHGPQLPIEIVYTDKNAIATKGLENWTTGKEELYNNITVLPTATPLATGKQGNDTKVVVWTNLYGEKKTRVFGTTLGHNDATVSDARYLDMVTKGVLWAANKMDDKGLPVSGYGRVKK